MCETEEGEGYMKGNCSISGVRNRMNCGALHRSKKNERGPVVGGIVRKEFKVFLREVRGAVK